jgi:hypothetical protein
MKETLLCFDVPGDAGAIRSEIDGEAGCDPPPLVQYRSSVLLWATVQFKLTAFL